MPKPNPFLKFRQILRKICVTRDSIDHTPQGYGVRGNRDRAGESGGYDFKWSIEVSLRKGRKGKQEMRKKEQIEK